MRIVTRIPRLYSLAMLVTLSGILVPSRSAPAEAAAPQAIQSSSATCARAAIASEWQGTFSFSFHGSASETDGTSSSATDVSQSATYTMHFGDFQAAEPDFPQARWWVDDVSGNLNINDIGVMNGDTYRTQASGGPLPPGFTGELGSLTIHTDTCTYTLGTGLSINALNQEHSSSGDLHEDISAFDWQYSAAINESADLTISGSANIPVLTQVTDADQDYASINGGHVARELISIFARQNAQSAGLATVTWALRPVAPQPRITKLELQRQEYPSGRLVPVTDNGVVDGEAVQVVATIQNPTEAGLTLPLRFLDGETNEPLPDGERSQLLPPKSTLPVVLPLKTNGWTWERSTASSPAPKAHPDHQITVKLGSDQNLYSTRTEKLRVRARPVILVHGLNSNAGTWTGYDGFLREINFTWKAYAIDRLRTGNSPGAQQQSNLLTQNAKILYDYIEFVRQEEQTWHVDIVAHSMGGLISRQYIHSYMPQDAPDGQPVVRHLVMIGTPNEGSACAYPLLGINRILGIPNIMAPLELTPEMVAVFNTWVVNRKGTLFSVLAGTGTPFLCDLSANKASDVAVLVPSAHHNYIDVGLTPTDHLGMTSSHTDFVNWVRPHLLDLQPAVALRTQPVPSATDQAVGSAPMQFTQIVSQTIPAGGQISVPIEIPPADRFAVQLVTAASVTATLYDPAGTIVQTSAASSREAEGFGRSLGAASPAIGQWSLRLENSDPQAAPAAFAVQVTGNPLIATLSAGKPDNQKQVALALKLTNGGAPVRGAEVSAMVTDATGTQAALELRDDGQHGDGAAGDGMYGAKTGPITMAAAVVTARVGNATRIIVAPLGSSATAQQSVFLPLVRR